jgi:hypothetical protein
MQWVCTNPVADIQPIRSWNGMWYRNFRTGEEIQEKAYGEMLRFFENFHDEVEYSLYNYVAEDKIACGERHPLPGIGPAWYH